MVCLNVVEVNDLFVLTFCNYACERPPVAHSAVRGVVTYFGQKGRRGQRGQPFFWTPPRVCRLNDFSLKAMCTDAHISQLVQGPAAGQSPRVPVKEQQRERRAQQQRQHVPPGGRVEAYRLPKVLVA